MTEIVLPPRWEPRPPPDLDGPPVKPPFLITVNEINSFLRCRRAWDITSHNRQGLSRKGMPAPALHTGSCVHYALAKQADGGDPEAAVHEFFRDSVERLQDLYERQVGAPMSDDELYLLDDQRMLVLRMIRAYFERYGTENPIKPYTLLAPEVTFCVPLVADYDVYLIGTMDAVTLDRDRNPVPLERKTYSRKPKRENWRFNHQMYGYAAALQILTGRRVPYGLYDGLRKTAPTVPQILKSGKVSKKWIDTTFDTYITVVRQAHGGKVPLEYYDILKRLKDRDRSPDNAFFTRFRVPISQVALRRWWEDAKAVAMEAAHYPRIYPNFEWQGCPMCKVKSLCHSIQAGENTNWLLANEYESRVTPTVQNLRSGPVCRPGDIKKPSDFRKFGRISLGHDSDPVMEVAPSGE